MLAGKGGYFAAIAANGHRTPAACARARIVVEEKTTLWIGANPEARAGALSDDLRSGSGDGGEQPVQAAFSRDEFYFVAAIFSDQFVVAFGDAQDGVYRLNPFPGQLLFSEHGREQLAQGSSELLGLQKERFR